MCRSACKGFRKYKGKLMKKYLYDYIKNIDLILKENKKVDYKKLKEEHLIKIKFFQHERLIHLIVTLFYALFNFLVFSFIKIFLPFIFIALILLVFLIFYVVHYFRLENGVQYLYKQYDLINERIKK